MKRWSWLALILIAVILGACGGDGNDTSDETTSVAPPPTSADISSGCWTAEQRAVPITVEGDKLVQQWTQQPAMTVDQDKTYVATIETEKYGTFEITFFPKDAPNTVNNFVCLARAGFYDNTTYHRIVDGFVVQGGDPEGTGRGGPGYKFNDEPVTRDYNRGIVAMANAGPNTNGSQYFICLGDVGLPKNYTIFGEVTKGMDVVDKISQVERTMGGDGAKSKPIDPVVVKTVTISES
jgi:cyclophilin family peptidyl-prolyl cis-trans isomerase